MKTRKPKYIKSEDLKAKISQVERFNPSISLGLSSDEVKIREEQQLVNRTRKRVTKSYWEIFATNLFSFFNMLLIAIGILMIIGEYYDGLFFLVILFLNIAIGLYQDIKARRLVDKLRLVVAPEIILVRDGQENIHNVDEIVLDDIAILENGSQISADCEVVDGDISVNESLLTGESIPVKKHIGDTCLAGSYVVSGRAYVKVTQVGLANYAEELQDKAKNFHRPPSEILKSIKLFFKVIGIIVIVIGVITIASDFFVGKYYSYETFKHSIGPLSGSLVAMIPSGMYLLTSMTLAVGVIQLAKRRTLVQELYCIEMLARVDTLCLDKTGTITDGTMVVSDLKKIDENMSHDRMGAFVGSILKKTKDNNQTAQALLAKFGENKIFEIITAIPFSTEKKYSAATFVGEGTWAYGAPEFIDIQDKDEVLARCNEYSAKGYRVLVIAHSDKPIVDDNIPSNMKPEGIILLRDNIRPEAKDTIKWFKENGVQIRIISGDNPVTVSEIAKLVEVEGYDKYISLQGKTIEEVKALAKDYVIFGRTTPEQKEALIQELKNQGRTVAMTGDGVNDILALKTADCSIAMASGAEAARNVSHLVLLDSNFACLPKVVEEGRRVINNLQRTCSLFLTKTFFAIMVSIFFLITSWCTTSFATPISYPFVTNNLYVWEMFSIGIASFFLALQPNKERLNGNFMVNIIRKAIPGGVTVALIVIIVYIMAIVEINYPGSTKISLEAAAAICILDISIFSYYVLLRVCYPFDFYRGVLFVLMAIGGVAIFFISAFSGWNVMKINFSAMEIQNVVQCVIIALVAVPVYYGFDKIFPKIISFIGENTKNGNQN